MAYFVFKLMVIMKKFITIILFLFSSVAYAQNNYLSVRGGLTTSTLIGGDVSSSVKFRPGFHVGVTANDRIADNFYLRISFLYNQLGFSNEIIGLDAKTRFHLTQLPISFRFYPTKNFSIFFGGQIDVMLNANLRIDSENENVTASYTTGGLGLNGGLGYEFKNYAIDLNYYYGITDLIKDVNLDWHLTSIELSIGYFLIKK